MKSVKSPYVGSMLNDLYSTDILTLSSTLENARLEAPLGRARKVSKLCGSWVEIDVNVENGLVTDCALRVEACALGQASAAILKADIIGASLSEIVEARDALYSMLKQNGLKQNGLKQDAFKQDTFKQDGDAVLRLLLDNRFSDLIKLQSVSAYPARHASTLLAFDVAIEAVEQALN